MEPGSEPPPGRPAGPAGTPIGLVDPEVVRRLYLEHGLALRRFVLGVVRDPETADDVLQATFAKAVESAHEARPESRKSWLFRVAFHEAITARRRRATRESALRRLGPPDPGRVLGPPDGLIRGETVDAVRKALDDLPEDQLRIVRERIYEGKTFAAIAREQGVPLGTVLSRMRRALERLRRALDPGEEGGGA